MLRTESEIFYQESFQYQNESSLLELQVLELSIPYLKKGDSGHYIDQFLTKDNQSLNIRSIDPTACVYMSPSYVLSQDEIQHIVKIERNDNNQQISQQQVHETQASVFHNFQKHLTIALRMIVTLNHVHTTCDTIRVAKQLWTVFRESTVTAKKMLHYILGEKNQHSINLKLLEKYGFKKVYQQYPEYLVNQAKAFLRIQALNQLKQANLIKYTSKRRIKNQQYFILYIKQFMAELQEGYLKKRIKKQKVLKD